MIWSTRLACIIGTLIGTWIYQYKLAPLIYVPELKEIEIEGKRRMYLACSRCDNLLLPLERENEYMAGLAFKHCPHCGLKVNYMRIKSQGKYYEGKKNFHNENHLQ